MTAIALQTIPVEMDSPRVSAAPVSRAIAKSFWYQWRSVISAVSVLGCWGLGLGSAPIIREETLLAWGLDALGWIFFTAGLTIRLWATLYIGGRKAKGLIDKGPYSICRNPLYWGTWFILLSAICMFKSGIFALGMVIPMMIYLYRVVPAEEAYLTEKLGESYLDYCNRVPRWLPRFRAHSTPEVISLNYIGMRAEGLRILGWIWLPFLLSTVCELRAQAWWYTPFDLP